MWRVFVFNLTIALFFLGLFTAPKAMGLLFVLLIAVAFIMNAIGKVAER